MYIVWRSTTLQYGKAALHLAAENGHEEVADLLLQHRAFVNAKSKAGISPVHFAAQSGHANLVKLLIDNYQATVDALSLVSLENTMSLRHS